MRKCHLCKTQFNDDDDDDDDQLLQLQHLIEFHNIESEDYFFKNLLKKKEGKNFKPGKSLCCDDFIRTSKVQKVHNFLKHYSQGKSITFENVKRMLVLQFTKLILQNMLITMTLKMLRIHFFIKCP